MVSAVAGSTPPPTSTSTSTTPTDGTAATDATLPASGLSEASASPAQLETATPQPGSDEFTTYFQYLNDNRQNFAGEDGKYSEAEIHALEAQAGASLPPGFGTIDPRLFVLLAASDADASDNLIDPATLLEPKLIAAINLADAAFLPGASQQSQEDARTTLDAAIQSLQDIRGEASNGMIADFHNRLLAKLGEAPDAGALEEAWAHVLGTFNPEKEGAAINDVIRAIQSGLPQADQERLAGDFDTIITTLNEATPEDRQKLAGAIAQGNISGEIIDQLQGLRTALDNPAAVAGVGGQADGVATNFLEAQIVSYGAPLPSEYLIAGLVRSGQIADPLALTDQDNALINEFSVALAERGSASVDPKFSDALGYAAEYLSSYDSVLKGQATDASAQALGQRLRWELGYEVTPDGVEEQNIDYMAVLSGDPSLVALSSVANQIRAENPELLQQLLTSDAWMQTYTFTAQDRFPSQGDVPESVTDLELSDEDQQFLRGYVREHQLDLTLPEHQQQLQDALRQRLLDSGAITDLDWDYTELNVGTGVDASVGQMSNLGLLALASQAANRAFGADGRPLVMDPEARAAQVARRAQVGDFAYQFGASWGPDPDSGVTVNHDFEAWELEFLAWYTKDKGLDLTTDAGKSALQDAFRAELKAHGWDPLDADSLGLDIGEPQGDLVTFADVPAVSDKEAKAHLLFNGQQVSLDGLIAGAQDIAQKMGQGVAIEEGDPGSLAANLLIPGYGLLHALENKPSLSARQEWVRNKLEQFGRSTDTLDHMLSLSMDQWSAEVKSAAISLGVEFVAIAGFAGAGVALEAGAKAASAAGRLGRMVAGGIGEAVMGLVTPLTPGDVAALCQAARKLISEKLPKVFGSGTSPGFGAPPASSVEPTASAPAASSATEPPVSGGASTEAQLDLSKLQKVDVKPGGGNPGAVYEDPDTGRKWLVKGVEDAETGDPMLVADRAKNEVLANELLRATGIGVPEAKLVNLGDEYGGGLGVAVEFVDDLKPFNPLDPAELAKMQEQFATHAWLANWDAMGMGFDNVFVTGKGQVIPVDAGGALLFRATGVNPKGADPGGLGLLDERVAEWETMTNSNPWQVTVFGSMDDVQRKQSASTLLQVSDDEITALVKKFGPGDEAFREKLAANLIARKNDLLRQAGIDPHLFDGAAGALDASAPGPAALDQNDRAGYLVKQPSIDPESAQLTVKSDLKNQGIKDPAWEDAARKLLGADKSARAAIEYYLDSDGAKYVNEALRSGNLDQPLPRIASASEVFTAREILRELEKTLVDIPPGSTFTRGIGKHGGGQGFDSSVFKQAREFLKHAEPGTVLQEPAFTSTTVAHKLNLFARRNDIEFHFTAGEGVQATPLWTHSQYGFEGEALFPPGQRFAITAVREEGDKLIVDAILLPNKTS